MKIAFIAGIILLLILAPVYLLPRFLGNEGSDALFEAAAEDLTAQVSELSGIQSIVVEPIKGDHRGRLRFAMVQAFHCHGRIAVLESLEIHPTDDSIKSDESVVEPDAILKGRIVRNEIINNNQKSTVQVMVVHPRDGKILWSDDWSGVIRLHGAEREFHKTAIVICLALAAGILVIFSRKEVASRETIREW